MDQEIVLGIDFGTTNSVCSVLTHNEAEVLENAEGGRTTPSVVYYTKEMEQNRPLVGKPALNKANEDPDRVIKSIKREMGESEKITVAGNEYRVEEIAADIIRKLRSDAAEKLDVPKEELTKTVVTTPAYWESDRNQAVLQAAEMAGFEEIRTIKEPAAAAISYGQYQPGLDKVVGVYDLGGGTFDFALVDIEVGRDTASAEEYSVIAQSGDAELGGDDWDQEIIDWLVSKFKQETNIDPLEMQPSDENPTECQMRRHRLKEQAREAKERLSNGGVQSVDITIPFFMEVDGEVHDINETLSQTQFESMTQDLLEHTKEPIYTALRDVDMSVNDIDEVILVGGSTRMPQVQNQVQSIFQQEPRQRTNPDEAVAKGAAIKGNRDDILLLEVAPLSLGIALEGDRYKRMIQRNDRLPAENTEIFTTAADSSTAVRIPVYQGEREIASENRHLKTLVIRGMTPGSKHSAQIEVSFSVRENGIINVQAIESTQNQSVEVELEGENRLPDTFVRQKIKEAKEMEEQDQKRKMVIDAKQEAEDAIGQAEALMKDFPHIFDEEEIEQMETAVGSVRAIKQDSTATLGELKEATEYLSKMVMEKGDQIRSTGAKPKQDAPPTIERKQRDAHDSQKQSGSLPNSQSETQYANPPGQSASVDNTSQDSGGGAAASVDELTSFESIIDNDGDGGGDEGDDDFDIDSFESSSDGGGEADSESSVSGPVDTSDMAFGDSEESHGSSESTSGENGDEGVVNGDASAEVGHSEAGSESQTPEPNDSGVTGSGDEATEQFSDNDVDVDSYEFGESTDQVGEDMAGGVDRDQPVADSEPSDIDPDSDDVEVDDVGEVSLEPSDRGFQGSSSFGTKKSGGENNE